MDYGLAGAAVNRAIPAQPNEEQLSTINGETTKILFEASSALEYLITKHLGPRPLQTPAEQSGKEPSRSMRTDALILRRLATEVSQRVQMLHDQLGYN